MTKENSVHNTKEDELYTLEQELLQARLENEDLKRRIEKLSLSGAEQALRRGEELFRTLFEFAPIGLYLTDKDGGSLMVNRRWREFSGMTEEQANGDAWAEALHPDDRKFVYSQWREMVQSRGQWGLKYRFMRPDGTIFWLHGTAAPVIDGNGELTGYIGSNTDITQLVEMQEQLEYREQTQRLLFENTSDALIVMDLETRRFKSVNNAAVRMFGVTESEFLEAPEEALPMEIEETLRGLQELLVHEQLQPVECECRRRHGQAFDAEITVGTIITGDENRLAIAAIRDVSGRKKAENALRAALAELYIIHSSAPIAMLLVDSDRVVRKVNATAAVFAGREPADMIGLRSGEALRCLHHLDDPRGCGFGESCGICPVRNAVLETFDTGMKKDQVEAWLPFSGKNQGETEERCLLVSTNRVDFDEDQRVLVCAQDITDRKRAEEALRRSEEEKSLILNSTSEIFVYLDLDMRVQWANGAAAESVGTAPESLAGRHCYEIWHQRTEPCKGCPTTRARATGEPCQAEITGSGGRVWLHRGYPVKDERGIVQSLVEVSLDVTDRVEAQKQKEQLQSQLLQAQKMEVVGQLAGGVAHDFNNMLAIIIGAASLAQSEIKESDPVREEIEAIVDAATRARNLTMKLLTFSRKEKLNVRQIGIDAIIREVTELLQRTLPKNIAIRTIINSRNSISCDENQIHQALLNICGNAADAMPGGGTLTIECGEIGTARDKCRICGEAFHRKQCFIEISDTGTGISGEILSRVVEPFFTTKGVGKGTGLGLSVTHGIIKSHDGHFHIQSEPEKGTRVTIFLPVSDLAAAPPDQQQKPNPLHGTETILVVDDERPLLSLAGRILQKSGYTPALAASGAEALTIYEQRRREIAAVVLDIMMPEMNGAEVYHKLMEIDPGVKVIFSSGFCLDGHVADLPRDVQDRFIQKPYEPDDLLRALRDLFDKPDNEQV